jgi:hypothetical protein
MYVYGTVPPPRMTVLRGAIMPTHWKLDEQNFLTLMHRKSGPFPALLAITRATYVVRIPVCREGKRKQTARAADNVQRC